MRSQLLTLAGAGVVAFLLATNPVVVHAAGQISGAGIKNGSVTGVDIKDRSLTGADVKDRSLTGADVKDGSLTGADLPLRVATASADNDALYGVTGANTALATTITAPAKGYLVIEASSDVYNSAASDSTDCYLTVDGTTITSTDRAIKVNSYNTEDNCATNGTVPVTPGTHTVTLSAYIGDAGTHYDESTLSALFVPFGATGKAPSRSAAAHAQVPAAHSNR